MRAPACRSVCGAGAMQLQLVAIRQLGPTMLAAVMPARLLSSILGSALVLGERVSGYLEALGMLIVAVTAAGYLGNQVLVSRRAEEAERQRSAGAEPGPPASHEPGVVAAATELTSTFGVRGVRL